MAGLSFESLKSGFRDYLNELVKDKPWKAKRYNIESDNISIFRYGNEFKDYLSKENLLQGSLADISIDDILAMQIINGQLVEADSQEAQEYDDAMSIQESEDIENNPQTNTTEGEISDTNDGEYATEGAIADYSSENEVTIETPEIIASILNDLFQDDKIREALNLDDDKELSKEEIKSFLDIVKDYDEDKSSISIEDIYLVAQDIENGTFRNKSDDEVEQILGDTPLADAVGLTKKSNSVANPYFRVPSTPTPPAKYDADGNPIYENFSQDELKSALTTANQNLNTKQDELNALKDGSDSELQKLKENENQAYEIFQEKLQQVDEELAKKLDEAKNNVELKKSEIQQKDVEITNQNAVVNNCEINLKNIISNIDSYNQRKSALEAANEDGQNDDLIDSIEDKIKTLEQEKAKAQKELEKAQKDLDNLFKQKEALEKELTVLEENLTEIEDEISEKYQDLDEYRQNYDSAKQNYTDYQNDAISLKETEVDSAQEEVNKIQEQINKNECNNSLKDYPLNNIIDFAKQMLGFSESQVEKMCGYNLPDGLWCAAFVKYVLTQTQGNDLPDWYTHCNFNSCSEVLAAANKNGQAFKSASEAQPGDLVIFNTNRGQARHIGIVTSVDSDGTVHTIEGNSSSKVSERTYRPNQNNINSFVKVR